jgi:hypothetical protein
MRAERIDAIGRRRLHPNELRAVGMAGHHLGVYGLARQRVGNKDRIGARFGNAIAAMADARNEKALCHRTPAAAQ